MSVLERLTNALADRYRVDRELGQGGMATVYLAHDLRHERDVAIKVLHPDLGAVLGADRFLTEIKTTAKLQHPHILPLLDSGAADGLLFYVMPFVEGETLRARLDRERQLPIAEALRLTREVADALQSAHERGIIHRDIKPENILLQGGHALVADFGIALAVQQSGGARMTQTGLSLGTPQYMAPEQAMGERTVDARADVYALGAVTYEMLTGEPPFTGATSQAIVARVLTVPPAPLTETRSTVPPHVEAAVLTALQKLPADRFESARAFGEALGNPTFAIAGASSAVDRTPSAVSGRARALHWMIGAGVGVLVTAAALLMLRPSPPAPEVVRFEMTLPAERPLDATVGFDAPFAISPDGKLIVFAARDTVGGPSMLHIREIGQLTSTPLLGTERGLAPFFSPDGLWVGFATDDRKLKKVPLSGGPPITMAEDLQIPVAGGSWGDDGSIVYTSTGFNPSRIRGTGGTPERLSIPHDSVRRAFIWPVVLPGGRAILFERCGSNCVETDLVWFDVSTKAVTVLVPGATRGWYLPSGHLVYATKEGAIFAAPFDATKGALLGSAAPVLNEVRGASLFGFRLTVSTSGAMMYLRGTQVAGRQVVEVDRAGRETVVLADFADYSTPRWSPTRDRIALRKSLVGDSGQIMIYDVGAQTLSQLTSEGNNRHPSWSPDGRRVAFYSRRENASDLYWMPSDRSASAERVADGDDTDNTSPTFWTRDGAWIVIDGRLSGAKQDEDIFAIGTGTDRKRKTVIATAANEQNGEVSPDGKWIVYSSQEGGVGQVYVSPFMREGGRWLISTAGGGQARWTSNSELVYWDFASRSMLAATLELGPTVRVKNRISLFGAAPYHAVGVGQTDYDISRDGQRFLLLKNAPVIGENNAPVVVLHWADEVKRRMLEQGGRTR